MPDVMERDEKPLGHKSYGSIPHLPGSRRGPGDHGVEEAAARICLEQGRDRHDLIIVLEKLDGANVGIARIGDQIVALTRTGYRAETSHYEQHRLFATWVYSQWDRWLSLLEDGERLCGEWLAQAHSTRYALPHEPFVVFDIRIGMKKRQPYTELLARWGGDRFVLPNLLKMSFREGCSIEAAMHRAEETRSVHGALDPIEGAVWRVERKGEVLFLAKYVRPDKVDGKYLPEISGGAPVWNWHPQIGGY